MKIGKITGSRRDFLKGSVGAATLGLCKNMEAATVSLIEPATDSVRRMKRGEPQLFVDLGRIEQMANVTHVFHSAEKHVENPVLRPEKSWETVGYAPTASFIYDEQEKVLKCWYMGWTNTEESSDRVAHTLCYAISQDGIHWERPDLGLHRIDGSWKNNVIVPPEYHDGMDHWVSVLKDPWDDDPRRRYKAAGWSSYDWDGPMSGIYTMTSPDGLHWTHTSKPVFHHHPRRGTRDLGPVGDAQSLMIDTLRRRYVVFLRSSAHRLFSVSQDFVQWTPPATSLEPLPGQPGRSLYNHLGFVYGDEYLGLLTYFHNTPDRHYRLDVRLLWSEDGLHYTLPGPDSRDRPPLIDCGEIGDWDRLQTRLTGAPPLRVQDRLYLYYRGFSSSHDKAGSPKDTYSAGAIGLATIRVDGFASLGAGFDGGRVTTRPMVFDGARLRINAKANFHARLVTEVLDEKGTPIRGYRADECLPMTEDCVDHVVAWKNKTDVRELAGRPVRLCFYLTNARLYSYQIT